MSTAQPVTKDKPKDAAPFDNVSARVVGDVFHVRLGSGGGSGLVHQPVLLGRVSNPSVNGNG